MDRGSDPLSAMCVQNVDVRVSCSSHSDAQLAAFFIDPRAKWSTVQCYVFKMTFVISRITLFKFHTTETSRQGKSPAEACAEAKVLWSVWYPLWSVVGVLNLSASPPATERPLTGQSAARSVNVGSGGSRHMAIEESRGPSLHNQEVFWYDRTELLQSLKPVMILPQVHLRKPCYDFYFL